MDKGGSGCAHDCISARRLAPVPSRSRISRVSASDRAPARVTAKTRRDAASAVDAREHDLFLEGAEQDGFRVASFYPHSRNTAAGSVRLARRAGTNAARTPTAKRTATAA